MYHVNHVRLQALRHGFNQRGKSIVDWAKRNHFKLEMVYAALAGRYKGLRGEGDCMWRKKKALAETAALIVLRKKSRRSGGVPEED